MGLPELSLIALAVAVVVGIVRNVNVGPLSMAIVLVIGYYIGGVKIKDIIAGYPVNVFLILAGITLQKGFKLVVNRLTVPYLSIFVALMNLKSRKYFIDNHLKAFLSPEISFLLSTGS